MNEDTIVGGVLILVAVVWVVIGCWLAVTP